MIDFQLLQRSAPACLRRNLLLTKLLTVVGEVLSQVEEGDGHQDVEGPVDSGGAGVPGAPRPQRIDLRVDGPRHWTHTYEREMGGELLWRVLCSETQLSCCVGGS